MKKIISTMIAISIFVQMLIVVPVFSSGEGASIEGGVYKIITAVNNKNCISIERVYRDDPPSKENNAPAVSDRYRANGEYDIKIEKVGQKYRLVSVNSGRALTVKDEEKNGTPIVQRTINDSELQLFNIVKNDNEYYSFVTDNGFYIGVSDGSKDTGVALKLSQKSNAARQWFRIIPTVREEVANPPAGLKTNLNIISYPTKTLYNVGDPFDSSGFLAYFMDSKKKVTVYPIEEFEFFVDGVRLYNGRRFTTAGLKKVNIECASLSVNASYNINVGVSENALKAVEAVPSNAAVIIDGQEIAFEAYNIQGSNYFKLRDIAMATKDGKKSFSIEWDATLNKMILTREQPYTPVGGELSANKAQATTAAPSSSLLFVGGTQYAISAYVIGGNNYFGLRDFMKIIDMKLDWDGARNLIAIDTEQYYQTGAKTETSQNPRTTIVRGIRVGYCPVDALKALYGEPTEILNQIQYSSETGREVESSYYVYANDYSQLFIANIISGYVVGVYSGTNLNLKGGSGISVTKYTDKIKKEDYATEVTNGSILDKVFPDGSEYVTVEAQDKLLFYLTNSIRAINGLKPLKHSPLADKSARLYAEEMAKTEHFDHIGLDGSTPTTRMKKVGISAKGYGENIIMGSWNAYDSAQGWYNSPGHRANMLNTSYTHLGNGYGIDKTIYAAQNFHIQ